MFNQAQFYFSETESGDELEKEKGTPSEKSFSEANIERGLLNRQFLIFL